MPSCGQQWPDWEDLAWPGVELNLPPGEGREKIPYCSLQILSSAPLKGGKWPQMSVASDQAVKPLHGPVRAIKPLYFFSNSEEEQGMARILFIYL